KRPEMAPKAGDEDYTASSHAQEEILSDHTEIDQTKIDPVKVKTRIVWRNVVIYIALHAGALYGFYVAMTKAMWATLIWCKFHLIVPGYRFISAYFLYVIGGLGITAGAHRLWSHRSYKANAPLRFILTVFNCIALQVSLNFPPDGPPGNF